MMSGIPQGLIPALALFNIFVSDTDSETDCTLINFADDIELEGRDAIQRGIDRLERWPCGNLLKLNKAKCKVLHMGWGNPKHIYRLGDEGIESNPVEKDSGVLADEKLNVSHQCMAQKASRAREVILPLCSALVRPIWTLASSSGALHTGRTWSCWSGSRGEPQN